MNAPRLSGGRRKAEGGTGNLEPETREERTAEPQVRRRKSEPACGRQTWNLEPGTGRKKPRTLLRWSYPARPLAATKRNGLPQRRRDTEVEKKQVISFFLCELCDLCVEKSSPLAKKLTVSSAGLRKNDDDVPIPPPSSFCLLPFAFLLLPSSFRVPPSFRSTLSGFASASGCFDGPALFFRAPNEVFRAQNARKRSKTMFFRAPNGRKRGVFERQTGAKERVLLGFQRVLVGPGRILPVAGRVLIVPARAPRYVLGCRPSAKEGGLIAPRCGLVCRPSTQEGGLIAPRCGCKRRPSAKEGGLIAPRCGFERWPSAKEGY
jgi:hypothetical protein